MVMIHVSKNVGWGTNLQIHRKLCCLPWVFLQLHYLQSLYTLPKATVAFSNIKKIHSIIRLRPSTKRFNVLALRSFIGPPFILLPFIKRKDFLAIFTSIILWWSSHCHTIVRWTLAVSGHHFFEIRTRSFPVRN